MFLAIAAGVVTLREQFVFKSPSKLNCITIIFLSVSNKIKIKTRKINLFFMLQKLQITENCCCWLLLLLNPFYFSLLLARKMYEILQIAEYQINNKKNSNKGVKCTTTTAGYNFSFIVILHVRI